MRLICRGKIDLSITYAKLSNSHDADIVEVKFVQLKSGKAGLSGMETTRLKQSIQKASLDWVAALFDGTDIHFLPDIEKQANT